MKLESKSIQLSAKMKYGASLVKEIRHELNKEEITEEKIKKLKDYASDISDFLNLE